MRLEIVAFNLKGWKYVGHANSTDGSYVVEAPRIEDKFRHLEEYVESNSLKIINVTMEVEPRSSIVTYYLEGD
ncbi:MAG: hypothetical protein ACFE7R_04760 [Candidatus Hodarchaeota archaeon]